MDVECGITVCRAPCEHNKTNLGTVYGLHKITDSVCQRKLTVVNLANRAGDAQRTHLKLLTVIQQLHLMHELSHLSAPNPMYYTIRYILNSSQLKHTQDEVQRSKTVT